MNAPPRRPQAQEFELDPLTRTRLHLASQIAAGLCSNPENMISMDWEGSIARSALSVADKLIRLTMTGGC